MILSFSSAIFGHPQILRAELLLKRPIFLGSFLVICILLQIWVSYVSAGLILGGELILGLSLFLAVPALGCLMIFSFLWSRRQRAGKPRAQGE